MKIQKLLPCSLFCALLCTGAAVPVPAAAAGSHPIYRVYNPNSGEHFYTAYSSELNSLIYRGWRYEGTAWTAPDEGWYVYRMYNPNVGDHHYTMDETERDALVSLGWKYEGVAWGSPYIGWSNPKPSDASPVYRLYNPNASVGAHHYTTSASEANYLIRAGWSYEGIGWYTL